MHAAGGRTTGSREDEEAASKVSLYLANNWAFRYLRSSLEKERRRNTRTEHRASTFETGQEEEAKRRAGREKPGQGPDRDANCSTACEAQAGKRPPFPNGVRVSRWVFLSLYLSNPNCQL